jgi:MFS family permease
VSVFLALFVCMTFALLTAITISRRFCKKKYSPIRFMLWLVLWMVLLGSFATLIFFILGSLILSSWPSRLISQLIQVLFVGLILGLFIYVLNLPFMLLGFVSPFFRERLYVCLRLKPKDIAAEQDNIESTDV